MENITVKDFLKKLGELETSFNIYVPSLGKNTEAKPLTLRQQKNIISTAVGGARGTLEFTRTINNAILENVKVKNLFPYDRVPIVVQLRKHALGDAAYTDSYQVASLEDVVKSCKSEKVDFPTKQDVAVDSLKLKLKIPTLKEETKIIDKCIDELERLDPEDASETVGTVFVFELIKYIDTVAIEGDTVTFNDLKIQDRVNIIEQLPLNVYNELVSFLTKMGIYESNILTVKDDQYISIDASFFEGNISDTSVSA